MLLEYFGASGRSAVVEEGISLMIISLIITATVMDSGAYGTRTRVGQLIRPVPFKSNATGMKKLIKISLHLKCHWPWLIHNNHKQ